MANTTFLKVTNNAQGHLAAGISNTDLTFTLQAGEGALFPSSGPFTVSTNSEIILCDSHSGDVFTVNASGRGYDGTTAETHLTGAVIELRWVRQNNDIITGAITTVENMQFPGVTFAQGGIPYRASSGDGALTPLAKGTANQVLKMAADASLPQWRDEYGAASIVVGEVPTGSINSSNAVFTTAETFATNSLQVIKNGITLKGGGADYTVNASNNGFTMTTAPATGTVLMVNYYKTVDFAVVGTNSLIEDETPTGSVNSSNKNFTVTKGSYIAGSLAVYLDGQKLTHTNDFTETTPGSGTFAFVTAPATGATVRVSYQYVSNTSGNADTVDGYHVGTATGQIPIIVGQWQTWTPSLTPNASMTWSITENRNSRYCQIGKTVFFNIAIKGTTGGTPSTWFRFTPPVTPAATWLSSGGNWAITGMCIENGGSTVPIKVIDAGSDTDFYIFRQDSANFANLGTNYFLFATGIYEAA